MNILEQLHVFSGHILILQAIVLHVAQGTTQIHRLNPIVTDVHQTLSMKSLVYYALSLVPMENTLTVAQQTVPHLIQDISTMLHGLISREAQILCMDGAHIYCHKLIMSTGVSILKVR